MILGFQLIFFMVAAYFGWAGLWGVFNGPGRKPSKPVAVLCVALSILFLVCAMFWPTWIGSYIRGY